MRICPECHAVVRATANFCDHCGRPLNTARGATDAGVPEAAPVGKTAPGICSSCGFRNLPGELFCQKCGVQLAPVPSAPPPLPRPVSSSQAAVAAPQPLVQCPSCGFPTNSGDAYCPNCGARIASIGVEHDVIPRKPVQAATSAEQPKRAIKLVVRPSNVAILLDMDRHEWLIGRADPVRGVFPEIDLGAYEGDQSGVSRRHARLISRGDRLFISDLNSTNYTFLNGERLQAGQLYPLANGDEIRFGLLAVEYFEEVVG